MAQQTPVASKREIEDLRGQVADLQAEVERRKEAEEAPEMPRRPPQRARTTAAAANFRGI